MKEGDIEDRAEGEEERKKRREEGKEKKKKMTRKIRGKREQGRRR